MKKPGNILIVVSLLITLLLWIFSKTSILEITSQPVIAVNQITALLGTILFAWSMILATRLDFLEALFGGLDKIYRIHRKTSEIGAVLLLLHPVALAISVSKLNLNYFLPIHRNISINFGAYSFWVFAIAILLTLFIRKINLPYHLWKQTHKFLNLAMILAFLHVITVRSDTSSFILLGNWMYLFTGLGVASGIYMSFLYEKFGPKYKYEIVKINRHSGIHDVYLKSIDRKLPHKIAQYAYVSFVAENVPRESHPFCIASLPDDELLRLSIKELGDYTKKINELRIGDQAIIYGPYGKLGGKFDGKKDSVFIGGGIGIVPFLSMFKKASLMKSNNIVNLFYCTKYRNEAVFNNELMEIAGDNPGLNYYNQCSREPDSCRLSTTQVKNSIRNASQTDVYLCGPKKMMLQLAKELVREGFLNENIIFEDFEML